MHSVKYQCETHNDYLKRHSHRAGTARWSPACPHCTLCGTCSVSPLKAQPMFPTGGAISLQCHVAASNTATLDCGEHKTGLAPMWDPARETPLLAPADITSQIFKVLHLKLSRLQRPLCSIIYAAYVMLYFLKFLRICIFERVWFVSSRASRL